MAIRKKAAPAEEPLPPRDVKDAVPYGVQVASAWSWRILVIAGALALLIFLIVQLRYVVVPFLVAVLVAAPPRTVLRVAAAPSLAEGPRRCAGDGAHDRGRGRPGHTRRHAGAPRVARGAGAHDGGVPAVPGLDRHVAVPAGRERDQRRTSASSGSPSRRAACGPGALEVAGDAGHVLAGILLALFATLFILIDGRRVWRWIVGLFPKRARPAVDGGGRAGWVDPHHLREGADLRRIRGCGGHRPRRLDPRSVLRRLPAGDPDRGRGVPRFVHPGGRCPGLGHPRRLHRAGVPRPDPGR